MTLYITLPRYVFPDLARELEMSYPDCDASFEEESTLSYILKITHPNLPSPPELQSRLQYVLRCQFILVRSSL